MPKIGKIGVYGDKTRRLQMRLSYEKVSLTHKLARVYKYLGPYTGGDEYTIPDPIFLEVRDRMYATEPEEINIAYEPINESSFDLSKFGIISPMDNDVFNFKVHLLSFEESELGRFLIVGDILDIPFLTEDFTGEEKHAWFEVTDVDSKNVNETFFVNITAKPLKRAQENLDIEHDNHNQDILDILDDAIEAAQEVDVPLEGFDGDTNRDQVSPFRDEVDDFLDNPNKKVF